MATRRKRAGPKRAPHPAARAAGKAKRPAAKPAGKPMDHVDAALELARLQGWRHLSLNDIAAHAHVPLTELYARYPSKTAILDAFAARIDQAMLAAGTAAEADESARDRLFDAVMRRLDALRPYKDSVRAILRDLPFEPASAGCAAFGPFRRGLTWILESAGLDSSGPLGVLRRAGLGLIYLDTLRVWLADDSEDMSKTMAALDQRLRRAEELMGLLPGLRRRGAAAG